jgi:hypothetical protein
VSGAQHARHLFCAHMCFTSTVACTPMRRLCCSWCFSCALWS